MDSRTLQCSVNRTRLLNLILELELRRQLDSGTLTLNFVDTIDYNVPDYLDHRAEFEGSRLEIKFLLRFFREWGEKLLGEEMFAFLFSTKLNSGVDKGPQGGKGWTKRLKIAANRALREETGVRCNGKQKRSWR